MPRKDHSIKREDLVKAAFRVISRSGLAAATVREVAREAGRSPGALVHYMASKDQLLLEVSDYSSELVRKRMIDVEDKYEGIEALRHIAWATMPLDVIRQGHWRIWLGFWERSGENEVIRRVIEERYAESHERFGRVIKKAQQLKEISSDIDVKSAAQSFSALIDGLGFQTIMRAQPMSAANQQRHVDDWINAMLQPKKKLLSRRK
jgi:AcrR family transcriptional regulator